MIKNVKNSNVIQEYIEIIFVVVDIITLLRIKAVLK